MKLSYQSIMSLKGEKYLMQVQIKVLSFWNRVLLQGNL